MELNEKGEVVETVKHTDLAEGGPARVSGELNYDPETNQWEMDSNSGRYSTLRVGERDLLPDRSMANVQAAADLAKQSGGTQNIVPVPWK
jgi:hypothetical protein